MTGCRTYILSTSPSNYKTKWKNRTCYKLINQHHISPATEKKTGARGECKTMCMPCPKPLLVKWWVWVSGSNLWSSANAYLCWDTRMRKRVNAKWGNFGCCVTLAAIIFHINSYPCWIVFCSIDWTANIPVPIRNNLEKNGRKSYQTSHILRYLTQLSEE